MALWYRTGTVAVTNGSVTVTGTGTAFIANVRVGAAFVGPDGRVYEVASVVSNTVLTLETVYLGSTQTGQAYAIQPTYGVVESWAASADTLISTVNGYVAGPLAGKFPDGTPGAPAWSFGADPDTGVNRPGDNTVGIAAGGANRVLVSPSALTVNVPVAGSGVQSASDDGTAGRLLKVGAFGLGGTSSPTLADVDSTTAPTGTYRVLSGAAGAFPPPGEASVNGVLDLERFDATALRQTYRGNSSDKTWTRRWQSGTGWIDWQQIYSQGSILGATSHASGVPTGALMEESAGANGRYLRLADGTQICSASGSLAYVNGSVMSWTWTFPGVFNSAANLAVSAVLSSSDFVSNVSALTLDQVGAVTVGSLGPSSGQFQLRPIAGQNFTAGDNAKIFVTAIGTWAP